jgi:hypothetical protein
MAKKTNKNTLKIGEIVYRLAQTDAMRTATGQPRTAAPLKDLNRQQIGIMATHSQK